MNMLWNNDIKDVCVVFESWHISGPLSMVVSWYVPLSFTMEMCKLKGSMVIIAISIIYAYILSSLRRLDRSIAHSFLTTSTPVNGRRESMYPSGDSRRGSSLIPPIPNSYGVVESGSGGKIGVYVLYTQTHVIWTTILINRTKLPIQARLIRAGIYALLVAMSYWVSSPPLTLLPNRRLMSS